MKGKNSYDQVHCVCYDTKYHTYPCKWVTFISICKQNEQIQVNVCLILINQAVDDSKQNQIISWYRSRVLIDLWACEQFLTDTSLEGPDGFQTLPPATNLFTFLAFVRLFLSAAFVRNKNNIPCLFFKKPTGDTFWLEKLLGWQLSHSLSLTTSTSSDGRFCCSPLNILSKQK